MYLIDTNIFLEILLNDSNRNKCEKFLNDNISLLFISDFSLHSIGIILFKKNKPGLYQKFIQDIISHITIVTLDLSNFECLWNGRITYNFDFDDAFQYCVAKHQGLTLITQDEDFKNVTDIKIEYL